MPQLPPRFTRKTCKRGHNLLESGAISDGRCKECKRLLAGYKGLANRKKTHCPKGHPYSGKNLSVYRRGKYKIRTCRTCKAERARKRYWNVIKPVFHPGKPGRPRKYDEFTGQVLPTRVPAQTGTVG